jgi:AraC-like DNA-binding protein
MNQHPPPSDMQQPLRFSSSDFASPDLALERFRKLTEDICNVILLGETKDFYVSSTTQHLSGALLLEARSSALRYDRTSRHVARGIDHFQLVMYLGGGAEFVSSDRTYRQRAGDVSVIDMGQPSLTREMQADDGATSVVSFVLPRLLLAPLLSAADSGPMIRIIPREAPYAGMLSEYMLSLRRCALELTHRESQAAVQSLAQLVAGGCNRRWEDDRSPASASQETLRARIKTHIENNLGVASLGIEPLCREFALSRTGLYRLFAPQSPMSYIHQRRLHRAFAMLISPAFRTWRILDIALECQFASDATFIRAFRRQFDLSPSEARKLSKQKVLGAPPGGGPSHPEPDAEASRWVSQLTGAVLTRNDL